MTLFICAWCAKAGQPSFLREAAPYDDNQISHGICEAHAEEWQAQAAELQARPASAVA